MTETDIETAPLMHENVNSKSHEKLKPGTLKKCDSRIEELINKKQALRMQKSRTLTQLKKKVGMLKKQSFEPVEALCIIKDVNRDKYKYFGYGQLIQDFEEGKLKPDHSSCSKLKIDDATVTIPSTFEELTPGKYPFPFITGSGKALSEQQKKDLENVAVETQETTVSFTTDNQVKMSRKALNFPGDKSKRGQRGRGGHARGRGRGKGQKRAASPLLLQSDEHDQCDKSGEMEETQILNLVSDYCVENDNLVEEVETTSNGTSTVTEDDAMLPEACPAETQDKQQDNNSLVEEVETTSNGPSTVAEDDAMLPEACPAETQDKQQENDTLVEVVETTSNAVAEDDAMLPEACPVETQDRQQENDSLVEMVETTSKTPSTLAENDTTLSEAFPPETQDRQQTNVPEAGTYIEVQFGEQLLPAVVEDWPWARFFQLRKKPNIWAPLEVRHTLLSSDIVRNLEPPELKMLGRRKLYKF